MKSFKALRVAIAENKDKHSEFAKGFARAKAKAEAKAKAKAKANKNDKDKHSEFAKGFAKAKARAMAKNKGKLKEAKNPKFSFKAADKYFKDIYGSDHGTTIWDDGNWLDSNTGEVVPAKEPKKPAGAKEYSGDFKNPIKEAKSSYEIYHDSMSAAFTEVENELAKKGMAIEAESRWNDVATGPAKPGRGKTNRYNLALTDKNGKTIKKRVQVQIYNRETSTKTFELNMYVG